MFRRAARIFCVTVLLLLLATALLTQFWYLELYKPHGIISVQQIGVIVKWSPHASFLVPYDKWGLHGGQIIAWSAADLLWPPHWSAFDGENDLLLPWWLLLLAGGFLTASVWFLTRRRTGPAGAFPVELSPLTGGKGS